MGNKEHFQGCFYSWEAGKGRRKGSYTSSSVCCTPWDQSRKAGAGSLRREGPLPACPAQSQSFRVRLFLSLPASNPCWIPSAHRINPRALHTAARPRQPGRPRHPPLATCSRSFGHKGLFLFLRRPAASTSVPSVWNTLSSPWSGEGLLILQLSLNVTSSRKGPSTPSLKKAPVIDSQGSNDYDRWHDC